jgi:hypothetical protein
MELGLKVHGSWTFTLAIAEEMIEAGKVCRKRLEKVHEGRPLRFIHYNRRQQCTETTEAFFAPCVGTCADGR